MRTSQSGIDLIKKFEGCRLTAYKCAAGVWTIGYGHTAGVYQGMKITQVQAESYLKNDLVKYEAKVSKYSKYNWNQNQFDALVSFAYNVGSIDGLTANGTRTIKQISDKISAYNKAAGKVLAGLTTRRKAEQKLFNTAEKKATVQAASAQTQAESGHVQLNYVVGKEYKVTVLGLRIRTKKASEDVSKVPTGKIIDFCSTNKIVTCKATGRVGKAIWMYIGTDSRGYEQWICADDGTKAYVVEK